MTSPPTDQASLLNDWWRRSREAQWAHYATDRYLTRSHYAIGIPIVLLTAFSGTSVFYVMTTSPNRALGFVVATTAVVAAVLGGLQTVLHLSDQAAAHRAAAVEYSGIRRYLEEVIANYSSNGTHHDVTALRDRFDDITKGSPAVPRRIWARTEETLTDRT
jgi:hypothetical protein